MSPNDSELDHFDLELAEFEGLQIDWIEHSAAVGGWQDNKMCYN